MSGSGGAAAAFGFRYQYLVTVETILDLYEDASVSRWRIGVDLHGQDSADIVVFLGSEGALSRAVQVKASMQSSVKKMDKATAQRCIEAMAKEHPLAQSLSLRTNRVLSQPADDYAQQLSTSKGGRHARWSIDARAEDVRDLVSQLIGRIARIRQRGSGGMGQRLHFVLLAQLIDLVADRGSRTTSQFIEHGDVAGILDEPAALLADAVRSRSWGKVYGMPRPAFLPRPAAGGFLSKQLTESALYLGAPPVAVLQGVSGSGKSAAAAAWAANRREHYAVSLWLDAATDQGLSEQIPRLLDWLGVDGGVGNNPAQDLCDALSGLPVPWLLVLDGACDYAVTSKWIPASGYGHVVITTNRGDWPTDTAPLHEIASMTDDEALALIRHRLPSSASCDDDAALRFATRVGRWPLAVDVACAWVRRLGGDCASLEKFIPRLDSIDPLVEGEPLGSYPKTPAGVVGELWDSLSTQSRSLLSIIVISGGAQVSRLMLDRWANSLPSGFEVDAGSAIDELVASALVTCRLRDDTDGALTLDEVVYVHEGIQAVLDRRCEVQPGCVARWVETFDKTVEELFASSNLADVVAMLPVAAKLVDSLRSAVALDARGEHVIRSILVQATTMMHNFGQAATLTGLFASASEWFRLALDIRDGVFLEAQRATSGYAAMQIETLAALVQVTLRQNRFDEIQPIVERALKHLAARSVDDFTRASEVMASLGVLAESLKCAPEDCSHLRERLDAVLASVAPRKLDVSALQGHVDRFNDLTERARELAAMEQ